MEKGGLSWCRKLDFLHLDHQPSCFIVCLATGDWLSWQRLAAGNDWRLATHKGYLVVLVKETSEGLPFLDTTDLIEFTTKKGKTFTVILNGIKDN